MEISNKVALITGGASGLGLATAEVLVDQGQK
jgi:NAD(P)-dependent dehydrogenase (short-subunit alcohol dehydrogenase family)